jgi:anti-anti-sigma factor
MAIETTSENRSLTIRITDSLIYSNTNEFSDVLRKVKETDLESCAANLHNLEHIDSSGLRMLLLLFDACREKDVALTFAGAKGQVKEMLLHCNFDTIVTIA